MRKQDQEPSYPVLNSTKNSAKRLSISVTTLYALINSGKIRAVRLGFRTLIPESELQRFAAGLEGFAG